MLKRNSNIELLRILSMIMIILGHCNIYGNYDITNMNHFFNKFVIGNTYLGNLGVIIFVLTTGYFMIQKEIRIKKVILFELQVLFYSVGIYILFCVISISNFNLKEMIKCFFPIITKQYWFFSVYIIFYLFIPYVNKFILSLNKKDLNRYILMMIICFSIVPTFLSVDFLKNELLQFLLFYSLGAYVNINVDYFKNNKKIKYILLLCIIILFAYTSGLIFFSKYNANLLNKMFFLSYRSSILMIIIAICLLSIFLNFKNFSSKIINNISSCVFGIYLIHDNPNVRVLLWNNIFNGSKFINSYFLILYMILSVLIIFMISLLIELIRKYTIEKFNIKCLDMISKQYYKIIEKNKKLI